MATLQEKKDFVHSYFEYFNKTLIADIENLLQADKEKGNKLSFTFPYILLVASGIDCLGGVKMGFIDNSTERSKYFIEEWMGAVNNLYKMKNMDKWIYDRIRCGVAHQVFPKIGSETYKGMDLREKHLYVRKNSKGEKSIFIQTAQFAEDFLIAQKNFQDQYILYNIDDVFNNLTALKRKDSTKLQSGDYQTLISNFENNGKYFEKDFDDEEDERVKPSAAPK
jgi:hypothetical protein